MSWQKDFAEKNGLRPGEVLCVILLVEETETDIARMTDLPIDMVRKIRKQNAADLDAIGGPAVKSSLSAVLGPPRIIDFNPKGKK